MTITLAGATGVSTTAAARGTTSTTVAYTAVAAGRLAIITAVVKPSTATWGSDPAGWTKVTDATGGTGTAAADTGTSRIGKWYRVLDGSESGSVTISASTSPSAVAGCMDVYAKTRGSWATPISVNGTDASQGTNPTAASGTWAEAINVGDFVHVGYATNTDVTTAITAQAISQTGTTFAATTARSRVGNSSGFQNTIFTYDAAVTSVTAGAAAGTGATTTTVTWAATSSGAFGALRIREYDNTSAVTDDFADGSQNANVYGPDSYGTFSETGGRLRVAISTTYSAVYSPNKYRFDDVFFRAYPAPGNGAATEAYSAFWLDSKSQADGTTLGFFYDGINDQLYLASWVGYSDGSQVILNTAATSHPYWRLLRSSTNVLWQTSTDGSTWTTQRTAAMPSWVANGTDLAFWWEGHRVDGSANNYEIDDLGIAGALVITTTGSAVASATAYATAGKRATVARSATAEATARATASKTATVVRSAVAEATARATSATSRSVAATATATAGALSTAGKRATIARAAVAEATARATAGKLRAIAASATASATAYATTTKLAISTRSAVAEATARAVAGRLAAVARSATATAGATAVSARLVALAGSATASATAYAVAAALKVTARAAGATAGATAVSGTLRVTSGSAQANATARASTGNFEQHPTTGSAVAEATARATTAKSANVTRSATATAGAASSTSSVRTKSATAAATAGARATTSRAAIIAGSATAAATARSVVVGRHTTTGSGVLIATAYATTGNEEQHTTTGRAQAGAGARALSAGVRPTTGRATAIATAYATRPAGTSNRPPIVSSSRPSRLTSVGRSSRLTTELRPRRIVDASRER